MSPTIHKVQFITIAVVLLVFTSLPATAQYGTRPQAPGKPSFSDEVTVTATGVETEVDEAPTAVTVVTRDEIDDAQADRVVDMLRRVPGLAVVGSGDAGKLTTVFTRGTTEYASTRHSSVASIGAASARTACARLRL
jgi:outer membrane cobalamin receptor